MIPDVSNKRAVVQGKEESYDSSGTRPNTHHHTLDDKNSQKQRCVKSVGFRRGVVKVLALLECSAALVGSCCTLKLEAFLLLKSQLFWDVTPRQWVSNPRHFQILSSLFEDNVIQRRSVTSQTTAVQTYDDVTTSKPCLTFYVTQESSLKKHVQKTGLHTHPASCHNCNNDQRHDERLVRISGTNTR